MSTQNQMSAHDRGWLIVLSKNAVRMSIAGSAVAMMAMAAQASVGETTSMATATFTPALQMSIGFCALAAALYRRQGKLEPGAVGTAPAIHDDQPQS